MSSVSKDIPEVVPNRRTSLGFSGRLATFPWWLAVMAVLGVWVIYLIANQQTYSRIFTQLQDGVRVTLFVSIVAYVIALIIGMVVGVMRSYPPEADSGPLRVAGYHIATFYLELFRGLPILVTLLIITFVAVPLFFDGLNALFAQFGSEMEFNSRVISYTWRAIIALGLSYGAFLSEIFRAGIQSVSDGQREAAQALGLNSWQVMRYVVMPQAVRRILPPLGNDLIAMVKDSSLVAILAVRDITQLAKLSAGQSFLYLETYLVAAAIYLFITIIGSLLVRVLERRMGTSAH